MKKKITKIKRLFIKKEFIFLNFIFFISLCVVILLFPNTVYAGWMGFIESKLLVAAAGLVYAFVWFLGLILIYVIHWLAIVASYNHFIDVDTVTNGWVIVRDLCNMFFVLILLVIAFATILKIENYNAKKLLPKLLIMAVLINFSKTICGLIIDFSQVIMMTFVSGFAGGGINNLADILGMKHMLAMAAEKGSESNDVTLGTWGGILVALFAAIAAFIVITVMLCVLLMRVIMLWIYVILSPLAFLLSAFPAGQKYSSQWWSEFSKQVVVGPILAFFLWLALTTASGSSDKMIKFDTKVDKSSFESSIPAGFLKDDIFQTYIITLALLIGGLIVTQQLGGMAGAAAGRGIGWIRGGADLGKKGALGLSSWGARKFAGAEVKIGKRKFSGFEIRPTKIIGGIKEALEQKKRREDDQIQSKSAAALREGKLIRGGLGASKDLTEAAAHGMFWHKAWNPLKDEKGARKGVFGQTWQAGNVRKQIKKLEKDKEGATENRKKEIDGEIGKLTKELENYKTPYTFYAEQTRNAAIREQQAKIGDNDNEDDLIAMFDDAVARKDKEMAAAVMLTAAKVGHLNEIIQSQQATEDVKDETGKVVIKKGDNLDQSGYGLNALVNQKLIEDLGMSEQEAYSHQSQASSLAKADGHFNLAESIGVKNGLMHQRNVRGVGGQQERARGELRKVDAEKAIRNYGRLSWVDEIQYYDEKAGRDVRTNRISDLGKANFAEWADIIYKEIGYRRFNKNAAMNIADTAFNKGGLYETVDELEKAGKDKYWDASAGEYRTYRDLANELVLYGRNVSEGEKKMKEITQDIMEQGKEIPGISEKLADSDELEKKLEQFEELKIQQAKEAKEKEAKKNKTTPGGKTTVSSDTT